MMRRRQAKAANGSNGNDADSDGRRKGSSSSSSSLQQPVIPYWAVALICGTVVFVLVAQNHYQKTRPGGALYHPPSSLQQQQSPLLDNAKSSRRRATSLLSPEEDAALEYDPAGHRYHLIFSTDCSPYQHWQSFLVYYTAMRVKQPGHVTRVASGCTPEESAAIQQWFAQDVQYMSPTRFHLHLTPRFSGIVNETTGETVGDYKFFNKPFGSLHWLKNSPQLLFSESTSEFPAAVKDDIVILIDPDMALIRPITYDFTSDQDTLISKNRQEHLLGRTVQAGRPFAQTYGFGTQWARLDLEKIAGVGTPAAAVSKEDGMLYYPVGPPYLATVTDFYRIASSWSKFVPGTYQQYPHLLAEMFGYSIGAAHERLPHQVVDSLMVSDVTAGGEGWPLIDSIPASDVCAVARKPPSDHQHGLPAVVHMCQRYLLGSEWLFAKRRIPSDIYDCKTPLFIEPPDNLALQYDFKKGLDAKEKIMIEPKEVKRQAFMLCYLYHIVNQAATFYKQNKCNPEQGEKINLQKTRSLVAYIAATSK